MQSQDCKSFGLNQSKPCGADAAATGHVSCLPGVILSGSLPSVVEDCCRVPSASGKWCSHHPWKY